MSILNVFNNGKISLSKDGREFISPSYVGIAVKDNILYRPLNARQENGEISVHYEIGEAKLRLEDKGRYFKLSVLSVPRDTDSFVFGPYETAGTEFGEILGASWNDDGSVVCIQSLMPKVEGKVALKDLKNDADGELSLKMAADTDKKTGKITLQCIASDRSKEKVEDYTGKVLHYHGEAKGIIKPLSGADAYIEGAAIALVIAENADELLDIISEMELCEGLPHPTFNGKYIKTDKHFAGIQMIFSGEGLTPEERIDMAERAGALNIYFLDLFDKWGHFTLDKSKYAGGVAEIKRLCELAASKGLIVGTHTLSNFVTTNDGFVTPVPSEKLLIMDKTSLVLDIDATETEIYIENETNYAEKSPLNAFRIGSELITYTDFDSEKKCLMGCVRGAYGTKAAPHKANDEVFRLWDHSYKTLFPNAELQYEMVDNLARSLSECGIMQVGFDGLEGCEYIGHGEYGPSEFMRYFFEKMKNNFICGGSINSNYLWHGMSDANWGEPWYDSERRGGMYMHRVNNLDYYRRNLMFPMLGWFKIFDAKGKFEATCPENMEYIASRTAAFDAGCAITLNSRVAKVHGKYFEYLDLIKLWQDFRFNADIQGELREKLKEEGSNWHLERDGDSFKLTALRLHVQDLDYGDRDVETEAGKKYQSGDTSKHGEWQNHCSIVVFDRPYDNTTEPLNFRLRVGTPGHGMMKDLSFGSLNFRFIAKGGDYLEYRGGTELYHYDLNFNLKEIISGGDTPVILKTGHPTFFNDFEFMYATNTDEAAQYMLTAIRKKAEHSIKRKNNGEKT